MAMLRLSSNSLCRIGIFFLVLVSATRPSDSAASVPAQQMGFSSAIPTVTPDSLRLERIGFRLAKANASQCEQPEMLAGLMLHDIAGFSEASRSAARNHYGLTYGFGIRAVLAGSGAEQAGLAAGDEIIGVNGADLANFLSSAIGQNGTYDRIDAFLNYLNAALKTGPARLSVRRGSNNLHLMLQGQPGCGGRFTVLPKRKLNAWSNGRYVGVTTRMIRFAGSDDELAFVVAHEMAHNILHHTEYGKGNTKRLRGTDFSPGRSKNAENEADRLAVKLMAHAKFDLSASKRLMERIPNGFSAFLSFSHPRTSKRIKLVESQIAHLEYVAAAAAASDSLGLASLVMPRLQRGGMRNLSFAPALFPVKRDELERLAMETVIAVPTVPSIYQLKSTMSQELSVELVTLPLLRMETKLTIDVADLPSGNVPAKTALTDVHEFEPGIQVSPEAS